LQKFALDKMNARPDEIRLLKIEAVDWPDACLGATQAGEVCAQMITPGYRVQAEIKGKTYELHTDGGKFVRQAATPPAKETDPAAEPARLWLMEQFKIDSGEIQVVSVTEQTWPDGCLGVRRPDAKCSEGLVPGYRVLLEARGSRYEIRTSRDRKNMVLADRKYQLSNPVGGGLERPQITWKSDENGCLLLQAANDQAAFGDCWGTLSVVTLPNPDRIKELDALLKAYRPFASQTAAGEITFYGGGTGEAGPAQQRALAEWARMLFLEVSSKTPLPANGLALTWQRSGGIAGFCDDLKVYRSGLAVSTSCKGSSQSRWLSAAQLEQLYAWLDTLQTSAGKQSDPATADAMSITWTLSGSGTRTASPAEIQAILGFAAQVASAK
jgi:hypothetical protein